MQRPFTHHIEQRAHSFWQGSWRTMPYKTACLESCSRRLRSMSCRCSPSTSSQTVHTSSAENRSTPFVATAFLRPHLLKLAPYTPIEPFEVLSKKLGRDPHNIVKMDANENLYGPPPEVAEALGSMPFPNIYPDPECRALRQKLAQLGGTPEDNILVGCGADELIDLLLRCVLNEGDKIVDCPPTFTMYAFDTDVNAGEIITIPRLDGFKLDVPAIQAAVVEHRPKVVFLTSPNNPDGSTISEDELLEILNLPVLVVLDEAYIEFSGEESRMPWVTRKPNLIVLRTFSKSAGLAGLRVGYGAFPDELIKYLWRAKQPYNVSVAAETAALAALSNEDYMASVRQKIVDERERLFEKLRSIPFLEPFPSKANFILCQKGILHVNLLLKSTRCISETDRLPGATSNFVQDGKVEGRDAQGVKDALAKDHGIMVRHYQKKLLDGFIRISVGKPEHTDYLITALRSMV